MIEVFRIAAERRKIGNERLVRQINAGRIAGKILPNGAISLNPPKDGRYNTRELVTQIKTIMDRNERLGYGRVCHINNKWQLQVRGKDLRRVIKAMPKVRQEGRKLVERV